MAINVNAANSQAAQLGNNVTQLRNARAKMMEYKSSVTNNWQSAEVGYIVTAIDQVIGEIDSAIRNLESLNTDIRNAAAQIKREEEAAAAAAAAARARAAKQQQIQKAQVEYDKAEKELDDLNKKKQELMMKQRKGNYIEKAKATFELKELGEKIEKAEKKVETTYKALKAAKG